MSLLLNGVSQTDLNLVLTQGTPAVAGFARERTVIARPGYSGGIPAAQSTTEPRRYRFAYLGSREMTVAQRNAALQWLSALLTGVVELQPIDGMARRLIGLCNVYDASIASPTFVNVAPEIVVDVTCFNAAFEDIEPQQFAIGSTPLRMPIGTAGHTAQFILVGANSTAFTITYRSFSGAIIGQIACTPALLANETLIIDTGTEEFVRYNTSGAPGAVPSWNTTETWPEFLPRHAQRELGIWATLEASTAMGVLYRRNWEN